MSILQDLIVNVRNLRADLKVEPRVKIPIQVFAHDAETRTLIAQNRESIQRLANVESIAEVEQSAATLTPSRSTSRFDVRVVYEKKIDVAAECERLQKELEKIEKGIASGQKQLGNEGFLAKAPANVVAGLRKQQAELTALQEKTKSRMMELGRG